MLWKRAIEKAFRTSFLGRLQGYTLTETLGMHLGLRDGTAFASVR
jgi:hypothetical protein